MILLPADHPWFSQVSAMRESAAILPQTPDDAATSGQLSGYMLLPFLREGTIIDRDDRDVAIIRRAVLPLETEVDRLQT